MSLPVAATAPERRARGRPRLLAPDAVLAAALALLEEAPIEEFTLGRLANRLNVPISSLYTCFRSRDALLEAAGEHLFARFEWSPAPDAPWQPVLLSWMHAVARHFEHFPLSGKLLAWDQRVSPAWLRVLAPIITLLFEQGLRADALTRNFAWFVNGTIGLIGAHAYTSRRPAPPAAAALLPDASLGGQVRAQLEFWAHVQAIDHAEVLDAGFRALVAGVAAAIAGRD